MNYNVILLNFNTSYDTIECVKSLKEADVNPEHIIVVDNNSGYEEKKLLINFLSDCRLIFSNENNGFAGGNNLGIREAVKNKPDYIILLNNDTIVDKKSVRLLLQNMERYPEYSMGTGQIRYFPDTNYIWYNGGKLKKYTGKAIHINEDDFLPLKNEVSYKARDVSFISGCLICIRMSEFNTLGYLNDKFFLYLEDIEYSARAVKNKLRLGFFPDVIIYHKYRKEKKVSEMTLYYSIRNRGLLIDLSFSIIAKIYFFTVVRLKMFSWYLTNKRRYKITQKALNDYKNENFGKAEKFWNE